MLDSLVSLLPKKAQPYAKSIVAVLGAVVGAVVSSLDDVPQWLNVLVAVLTALGVYAVPNKRRILGKALVANPSDSEPAQG